MLIARANDFLCLGFAYFKFTVCLINRSAVYALQSIKKRRKWGSCHVHICFISNVWINGSGSCLVVPSVNKNWRDEKARRQIENLRFFFFLFLLNLVSLFLWFLYILLARLLEWVYCLYMELTSNSKIIPSHTHIIIYICVQGNCVWISFLFGEKNKEIEISDIIYDKSE